jgi:hypothetical protein
LDLQQAEPNLGDPLIGPSSIAAKPVPPGQQYIVVSVPGSSGPGSRFWIPNQGGTIPGAITVFDESNLVGGLSKTTQLNIVGAAISAYQPDGTFIGSPVITTGNIGITTNFITGINTTGISTGFIVANTSVPNGSTVIALGIGTVTISQNTVNL